MIFQPNLQRIDSFLRDMGAYFLFWFAGYVGPMFLNWAFNPSSQNGMRFFSVFVLLPLLFVFLGILFGRNILILHFALLAASAVFIWYSFRSFNPLEASTSPGEMHFYSGLIGFSFVYLCAPVLKFAVENYGLVFRLDPRKLMGKGGSGKNKRKVEPKRKRRTS